jgi:hypothetical protein
VINRMASVGGALLLLSAVGGMSVASTTARAQQGSAVCSYNYDNGALSPGLMSSTTRAAQWSAGPAPLVCKGSINGQEITGAGTIYEYGPLEGTCGQGKGSGWQIGTVPTAKGPVRFENPITFEWTGPVGPVHGPRLQSVFEFWPMAGDCVTQPVTRFGQATQGMLTGS